jgi:hypothetical protein
MNQRRILIGAFVGIIVFSFINLLGSGFWFEANQLILNLESRISFNKNYSNEESIILNYSNDAKALLLKNSDLQERKDTFYKLINKLDKLVPLSINLVLSKENKVGIFQNDISLLQKQISTPIQSIQNKDIELEWQDENNKQVLLDHSANPIEILDANEYDNGLIDDNKLRSKNIFLISPNLNLEKDDFNKLINYFEGRSIKFIGFSKIILFLCIMGYSILTAMMVYPARIAVFAIVSFCAFICSQISYSFFNHYLEISSLIIGLLITLLSTNIFDIDFQNILNVDFFKQELADEFKNFQNKDYSKKEKSPLTQTHIEEPLPIDENLLKEIRFDLKNKHYSELETKLEELAVEFEERCFEKIDLIQEKLYDLLSENEMSQRDNMRLGLIKHNFDQLLGEIDKNHFSMTPFRTEADQGFINVLEHYATKIYYQTKSKIQIQLESTIRRLDLKSQDKVNIYRILENIFSLIVQSNVDKIPSPLEIKTQIKQQNDDLYFSISCQGENLDAYKNSSKLQDCFTRLSAMKNAQLSIENKQGTNYIRFTIKNIFSDKENLIMN